MNQIIIPTILVAAAIIAALLASLGLASAVHLTSRRAPGGYLHLIFYAMLLLVALSTLVSGRDMSIVSMTGLLVEPAAAPRHPLLVPAQPLISLLLLTVSAERIISHLLRPAEGDRGGHAVRALLLAVFILFWIGTVAAPALLGAHPFMVYFYFYSLVIGTAAALATTVEQDKALGAARNAVLIFMAGSMLLVLVKPGLVLDADYSQGLLPGVPRLAGLAAHAVSLGILAQLGLLCLYARPYPAAWLNRLAWVIGLSALFLAQSKAAWISFVLCFICLVAVRDGARLWRRFSDPARPGFGMLSVGLFMALVLSITLVLMFGDLDTRLSNFFNSREGAQLASLTGRDKIWAIAWQEWQRNPVFGYGPLIWETNFRLSIGMPNATHAHNQFMDTLSRSGTVGAAALVIYGLVLLVLSVRYARATSGLSLALFLTLLLRSISEVPLSLFGYGAEMIAHVLLLMTLAATASTPRVRKTHAAHARASTVPSGLRPARNPLPTANFSP
ncbi:MAG: O-antigen polymerase [Polaromonas sp.]|nr:O-antigen polymerase [Polaromonas sp.]